MTCLRNVRILKMSGYRADFPASMRDARSVRAGIILAIIDFALMAMVVIWLFFVCGSGMWPGIGNPDTQLTLIHGLHLAVDIPAIILFALAGLFLPIWFAFFGLIVLFGDIFVGFGRINLLINGTPNIFCTLFMLFFDFIFFIVACMFLLFAISGITRFGLFGDAGSVRDEYLVPRPTTAQLSSDVSTAAAESELPASYVGLQKRVGASADSKRVSF